MHFQQINLQFVVWEFAEQYQTPGQPKLSINFSGCREQSFFFELEWASFVIDLSSTVITSAVTFGDNKVLPSFLQIGLWDWIHYYALRSEGMPVSEICGVSKSRRTHYPVGDSCEVLDKVDVASHLFIGGASWIEAGLRGMERKSDVIIFADIYKFNTFSNWQPLPQNFIPTHSNCLALPNSKSICECGFIGKFCGWWVGQDEGRKREGQEEWGCENGGSGVRGRVGYCTLQFFRYNIKSDGKFEEVGSAESFAGAFPMRAAVLLRLQVSLRRQKGPDLLSHSLAVIKKQLPWQDVLQRLQSQRRRYILHRQIAHHLHRQLHETRPTLLCLLSHHLTPK